MNRPIEKGRTLTLEKQVAVAHSAKSVGSGQAEVLSTPMLLAYMEEAAWTLLAPCLNEEQSSVGTWADLKHLAATPVGMRVRVEATVTEVDNRRVVFHIVAHDDREKIGEATHERFVVHAAKFEQRAQDKLHG